MLTILLALITILGDIGFGYMAYKLAKSTVTNQNDHTARLTNLEHVTLTHEARIKDLEARCSRMDSCH